MYRLVLHEVFVQVGLEKPLDHEVPSDYTISSRLMVHLEAFPEWVPGSSRNGDTTTTAFTFQHKPQWSISAGGGHLFGNWGLSTEVNLQFP